MAQAKFFLYNGYAKSDEFASTLHDAIKSAIEASSGGGAQQWLYRVKDGRCTEIGYTTKVLSGWGWYWKFIAM